MYKHTECLGIKFEDAETALLESSTDREDLTAGSDLSEDEARSTSSSEDHAYVVCHKPNDLKSYIS